VSNIVIKALALLVMTCSLWAELPSVNLPPSITLEVRPESAVEGRELELCVTVVHDPGTKIEEGSFELDGEPVEAVSVDQERVAPKKLFSAGEGLEVERFQIQLPPRKAGLYSLGPLSLRVDGVRYNSGVISVQIQGAVISEEFRLTAEVKAPPAIFPGQEVLFEYRIFFRRAIQLVKETLPLLSLQGFLPLGSVQVETEQGDEGSVQVIRQRARAVAPGRITVAKSVVEGMAIRRRGSQQVLMAPLLRAEAPAQTVEVLAFPEKDRPGYFSGALGSFVWRASSLDGEEIGVGQKVRVQYRVSGRGVLSTVRFPPLDSLPGLKESFFVSEPVATEQGGTKSFVLELRAKRAGEAVELPGFFFASFDPISQRYLTSAVAPIVFHVKSTSSIAEPVRALPIRGELVQAYELDVHSVQERRIALGWLIAAFIFALVLAFAQVYLKCKLDREERERVITSRELFYQAFKKRSSRSQGLELLKRALYLRLFECGLTSRVEQSPDYLVGDTVVAEVKALIELIDRVLYLRENVSISQLYEEASLLYHKLK